MGGLHDALKGGDREYARIFGKRGLDDGMCVHRWPYRDESCPFPANTTTRTAKRQ